MGKKSKKTAGRTDAAVDKVYRVARRVNLFDSTPSVKHVGRECRRVLWSLVECLSKTERLEKAAINETNRREREEKEKLEEDEQRAALHQDLMDANLLDCFPLEFGNSKSKKRKAEKVGGGISKCSKAMEPVWEKKGRADSPLTDMEEHNIYLVKHTEDGLFYPARVVGVRSRASEQSPALALCQFLGYAGFVEVPRSSDWMKPVSRNKRPLVNALLAQFEKERYDVPLPASLLAAGFDKYWDQRFRLFSRFEQGIELDEESWYSVTPELIADYISHKCQTEAVASKTLITTVVDCFSGCGGNSISLAKYFPSVVAVDIVADKLLKVRRNAAVYGVGSRIDVVCRDVWHMLNGLPACPEGESARIDLLLMSPPWGGPDYLSASSFNLKELPCGDGVELLSLATRHSSNVVYLLPRNIDSANLKEVTSCCLGQSANIQIEEIHLHGKHKLTALYVGPLFARELDSVVT